MTTDLVTQSYVPPELALDEYHPHNTSFFKAQHHLKRAIAAASLTMSPKHVQAAKMYLRGYKNVEIAAELEIAPNTVSTILQRDDTQKLIETLSFLNGLNEGPTMELRKRKLWEIATDNQQDEPKTSIAAIAEMNKMDGIGRPGTNLQVDTGNGVVINMSFGAPPPTTPAQQPRPIKDITPDVIDGD